MSGTRGNPGARGRDGSGDGRGGLARLVLASLLGALAIGGTYSCATSPPAVPVRASPVDLTLLAGRWNGEYTVLGGREGRIAFELEAGTDTARGEVLMFPDPGGPTGPERGEPYGDPSGYEAPTPIPIRFVRTERGRVEGELEPYRDPGLGGLLQTTFRGTWTGDVIDGTFRSRDGRGRVLREGWWRAVRTGGALEGAPARVGLQGPSEEELVALGRRLFEARGCAACHPSPEARVRPTGPDSPDAPALQAVVEHRTFPWIYHMVMRPDSMLREDPTARELLASWEREMPDLEITPWEALVVYEYLLSLAADRPTRVP